MTPCRLLIFIVAYNAEKTLSQVLSRIPDVVFDREAFDTEVLIIDDCSSDTTVAAGVQSDTFRERPVTILRNPVNQGYGGNQKIGYHYAIKHGFDIVALIHGDGQYAPEELPRLLAPLTERSAEAVFGSRMMEPGTALRGGMPRYKYVGNKILTRLENRLVGTTLSEYHSGYRLYACEALKAVPFEANSNGFDFDTDIIIQLHQSGARIQELPVPTFYGDEICHVNGIQYGLQILGTCVRARLYGLGLLYHRKFDLHAATSPYEAKLDFVSSHSMALAHLQGGDRVLDLGAGPGVVAEAVRSNGGKVVAVERDVRNETRIAADVVIECDLDDPDWASIAREGAYDRVFVLDVLEHLARPEELLRGARCLPGLVNAEWVITVPNIAFGSVRLMLLLGAFNQGKRGILDYTHLRHFTFKTFRALLEQNGFEIHELRGVPAPVPLALGRTRLSLALLKLNQWAIRIWRGFFSYQIFCCARPKPALDALLASAEDEGAKARRAAGDDSA